MLSSVGGTRSSFFETLKDDETSVAAGRNIHVERTVLSELPGDVDARRTSYDVPTMAAVGVVSGLLMMVTHEVLGHSLVTVLLGAHLVHVTSIDSSYSGPASPVAMRAIAVAGIAANVIIGWLVLVLGRSIPARSSAFRYFAWVFGHATLFMGSSYLAGFAFLPFGDVHAAIQGLPYRIAFQSLAVLTGAAIYRAAFVDARHTLFGWVDGEPVRSRELALVPYLAMGATVTLASLFNPGGALAGMLWGAAATFGANYGLLAAATVGTSKQRMMAGQRIDIARSGGWIAAGLVSTFLLFVVLGPGVPR